MVPIGGYVLPALDEGGFRRLPLRSSILFALGGPVANVAAAYVSLLAYGVLESNLSAFDALSFATTQLWLNGQSMVQAIATLFEGIGEISGIVGIVAIGGSQFGSTLAGLLTFSVAINLNLAIFNLLPFPPLDGGRIALSVLEKIYRPLNRIQAPVTLAGWVVMLALMWQMSSRCRRPGRCGHHHAGSHRPDRSLHDGSGLRVSPVAYSWRCASEICGRLLVHRRSRAMGLTAGAQQRPLKVIIVESAQRPSGN